MSSPEVSRPTATRRSPKIRDRHLAQLAIVYVRQSTPYQVLEHRESRERQYALAEHAVHLGWPQARVLLIDEDQGHSGQSALDRPGFQRLLTEVTLGHVGMVLSLEASRLARSHRDWYQLFELCAVVDTLLADEDGVYDANDPNDRLVLGLKGMMSELELLTMRQRLERGKLHKAQRGELFIGQPPVGYILQPSGTVEFDPDEQVQSVVRLIFAQFEELGSVWAVFRYLLQHGIRLGLRSRRGGNRGQLEWRRPSLATLRVLLRHPIYAGAYTYGRKVAPHRHSDGRVTQSSAVRPMAEWKVLLRDRLPAYITWEQYLANQEQLRRNHAGEATPGVPRRGTALLSGLVVCGQCGYHLNTHYQHAGHAHYACKRHLLTGAASPGHSLAAAPVDALVAAEVLRAVEPAALELSLQAVADVRAERERLSRHWQQQLARARHEAERTERQYQAVEPEDRLVARTLERRWEAALQAEARLQEEYDRFRQEQAPPLSAAEQAQIRQLASDIPALWTTASAADRKAVIRCLVERVVVDVRPESNQVGVTVHWQGGATGEYTVVRPVARYEKLADYPRLRERLRELRAAGHSAATIAARLHAEGFRPPRQVQFDGEAVRHLLGQEGLGNAKACAGPLGRHEWWLADLARELALPAGKLRDWILRGWLHARQGAVQRVWIVWADRDELRRLRRLRARSTRGEKYYPKELTTPKKRREE